MLKAIEYRAFFSKEERDKYNATPHEVWFNPSKVVKLEAYITSTQYWGSSHDVTTIYFGDNRSLKVHGSPELWVELIDSSTR
jgi:hypothetical protein